MCTLSVCVCFCCVGLCVRRDAETAVYTFERQPQGGGWFFCSPSPSPLPDSLFSFNARSAVPSSHRRRRHAAHSVCRVALSTHQELLCCTTTPQCNFRKAVIARVVPHDTAAPPMLPPPPFDKSLSSPPPPPPHLAFHRARELFKGLSPLRAVVVFVKCGVLCFKQSSIAHSAGAVVAARDRAHALHCVIGRSKSS
jgi:hypothetical protein